MNLKEHPIIQQYINWNKFGETLGMDFEIQEKGVVIYEMTIAAKHLATPRTSHGGALAGLMDAALGVACLSTVCEENKIASTVSMTVNFIRPALEGDKVTAFAQVIRQGKSLIFVEAKITNQHGDIVASGSASLNAYEVSKISHHY